ncbi:MAG: hypothetical protein LBK60_00160 [Verrucomicrobiales bacterium]|jgi:hypothetical protein|nr:hypothetical protein [Verrucomicrobiales bacterium]
MLKNILLVLSLTLTVSARAAAGGDAIYQTAAYTLYPDRVVQGDSVARIVSPTEIASDYPGRHHPTWVRFRFGINGQDTEFAKNEQHWFDAVPVNGAVVTPVVKFGQQYRSPWQVPMGERLNVFLPPGAQVTYRVDLNDVLKAIKEQGFYLAPKGQRVEKIESVRVAGNIAPLWWRFDLPEYEMSDADGDGVYEITVAMNPLTERVWRPQNKLDDCPRFTSGVPLADAVYHLGLDEMLRLREKDGTFRTGGGWDGVWTRDMSYSTILSLAALQPELVKTSLLRKVKNGKIMQDTGTGGAYPVSTDRMIWAVAAWELYKCTGDRQWLAQAYALIKPSIQQDERVVYDAVTGLPRGESSFLDWREQTYPRWMQSADIYESECLGTAAVHYQANIVAARMAELLRDDGAVAGFRANAERIKDGINRWLWVEERGYYGQFLYGRDYKILSPRSETLGEALCVLFGIADAGRVRRVIGSVAHTPFGTPCVYPQIPDIPPYHNNAVWPFVQTYWTLAAARADNGPAVMAGVAAVYRAAALFVTNKENYVAENGDANGTRINSDIMLWSVAGNLAIVHRLYFGMEFGEDTLAFRPFVPRELSGNKTLENFKWRGATLRLTVSGHGGSLQSFKLDGRETAPVIGSDLVGEHRIDMVLAESPAAARAGLTRAANRFSPDTPRVKLTGAELQWTDTEGAAAYRVLRDGQAVAETKATAHTADTDGEWQVLAVAADGETGFASEPVTVSATPPLTVNLTAFAPKANYPYQHYTGAGFVETSGTVNPNLTLAVDIPADGRYALDIYYTNGNGVQGSDNKCAMRTLTVDGRAAGTLVFPQRGKDAWSDWSFSNAVALPLTKGRHTLKLSLEPWNENMNADNINQAMLNYLRVRVLR